MVIEKAKGVGLRARDRAGAYAVILVGGKGKRLRPISSGARPKAFLPITKKDETMFKKTLDRTRRFVPADHIIVVANKRHAKLVKKDFPDIAKKNLILEPLGRNTAPAIAFAASIIEKRFTDAIMIVLPSDHYIIGEDRYIGSIESGIDFIRRYWRQDPLIVMGIKPRFPATGFGYIKLGPKKARIDGKNICEVERFVEKPDLRTAKAFLRDGGYVWNAGIFIFKASSILKAIGRFETAIADAVKRPGTLKMDTLYRRLPSISIDYAVMEKADAIYCVKGTYAWNDMGSLNSLRGILERELKGIAGLPRTKRMAAEPKSMDILEKLRAMSR